MMIERALQIPKNQHIFLFGPRQTGKSTLLQHLFSEENSIFYNLLETDVYRRLTANPEIIRFEVEAALASQKKSHVIVDEIQKTPQLLDEIHNLIEKKVPCNFILSGSSSRKLKRFHANMLAGRAWTFHLYPFIHSELKELFQLEKVLQYGSLPGVYLRENDDEKMEILRSYVDTYIKEEIEIEANIRNLGGFLRFLPLAAGQNSEMINYSNIAREAGISYGTVRDYYKILEDTLLGFFLLPFGRSIRKRLTKHPKFYFFDTGVVNTLTKKLSVPFNKVNYEYGKAFEHFFLCEVMRINDYNRLDMNISFYRTERGAEVDCIIETPGGKVIAIEIKSTSSPCSRHCSGLHSFKKIVPKAELILACQAPNAMKINGVLILPWKQALQYIYDCS